MSTSASKDRHQRSVKSSKTRAKISEAKVGDVGALKEIVRLQATSLAGMHQFMNYLSTVLVNRLAPDDRALRQIASYLNETSLAGNHFFLVIDDLLTARKPKQDQYKKVLRLQKRMAAKQKEIAKPFTFPTKATQSAIAEARARGALFRSEVMAQPYMWTGEDVGKRLGVSRQSIDKKRQAGELFALSWGANRFRYPSWQVEPEVYPHMKSVLNALGMQDPWTVFRFFTTPEATAGDQTPLDMLRKGQAQQVLEAARTFADRA